MQVFREKTLLFFIIFTSAIEEKQIEIKRNLSQNILTTFESKLCSWKECLVQNVLWDNQQYRFIFKLTYPWSRNETMFRFKMLWLRRINVFSNCKRKLYHLINWQRLRDYIKLRLSKSKSFVLLTAPPKLIFKCKLYYLPMEEF